MINDILDDKRGNIKADFQNQQSVQDSLDSLNNQDTRQFERADLNR